MDGISAPFVLERARAGDPARAGAKAATLARLADAFTTPDFFVITPDAFTRDGLRPDAAGPIETALGALGEGPFAVRSSGIEEDGATSAHAGQFETQLNVAREIVVAAAVSVWRSGFSETLSAYRRAQGLSGAPQPPAVIVQKMVPARAAGVAFSACPVTGARDIVVISATFGLADRLVAGEIDGDVYRIDAAGKAREVTLVEDAPVLSTAEQAGVAALARAAEDHFGAPQDIEWAIGGDILYLLQARPITTLAAITASAPGGSPARAPVAGSSIGGASNSGAYNSGAYNSRASNSGAPNNSAPDAGAPNTRARGAGLADDALTIWDNSNIVESYSGIVSPLTFSFARYVYAHVYRAFSALMGVTARDVNAHHAVFENMLGRVDGRIYYNLLNWYRALALFPGFQANRGFMEDMMGVREALPEELAHQIAPPARHWSHKLIDQLRFARVGLGLIGHGFALKGTIERFYRRLNAALAKSDSEIAAMTPTALVGEYRQLEQQLLARWDAPLVNDFLCMIAFGASRRALEQWAGPAGLALHGDVMIGQGDIVSAEPAKMIRAMGAQIADKPDLIARLASADASVLGEDPGLRAAFDRYLEKFGDRCTQELKLESVTLHEDPSPVLMAIAGAAHAQGSKTARVDPRARLGHLFKDEPVTRAIASWLLGWAKARVRDRENLRFARTRLFGRVRRIFSALGERLSGAGLLDQPRDIFLLTVEEALGAIEGGGVGQDLKGLVRVRRAEEVASRTRPDPPERFEVRGAHLMGLGDLRARAVGAEEKGETRQGLACCAGVVTARVRVIDDPRKEALAPGEILVARHTDPGWIAVFANAAGVIAERGSLLSHSAIVAREMGVPCVVALKGATTWLRTGDLVRLDGGAGVVERVEAQV